MNIQEALAWVADLFEESPENVKPETFREDIQGWDSLGVLTLIARLDEEFGILLSEEEMQKLLNVRDILEMLKRYGRLSEE